MHYKKGFPAGGFNDGGSPRIFRMEASLVGTVNPRVSGHQCDSVEGVCWMTPLGENIGGLMLFLGNTGGLTFPLGDIGGLIFPLWGHWWFHILLEGEVLV